MTLTATAPATGAVDSWALVTAAQAGDQAAFGALYDRYQETVFRYVLFRLHDRALAEDLTAETFLRALRRIGSVSYQGRDIGAWFITIARNLVADHVKSSRYRLEQTTGEIAEMSPAASGPEQLVVDDATHAELLRCVARLNPGHRECIALRFLLGFTLAETAQVMGRDVGAIRALQHRAVRRLAALFAPEGRHGGLSGRGVPRRPELVTLCGSMRFQPLILRVAAAETVAGAIVLAPFAVVPTAEQDSVRKARLDELHLRKIDLSDRVVVVTDESGYWGQSTRREIAHAHRRGIPVEIRPVPSSTSAGGGS